MFKVATYEQPAIFPTQLLAKCQLIGRWLYWMKNSPWSLESTLGVSKTSIDANSNKLQKPVFLASVGLSRSWMSDLQTEVAKGKLIPSHWPILIGISVGWRPWQQSALSSFKNCYILQSPAAMPAAAALILCVWSFFTKSIQVGFKSFSCGYSKCPKWKKF